MKKWERYEAILQAVSERGMIYLARACEITGGSEATIRRDFQELEKQGSVERFHGGIRVVEREGNLSFETREVKQSKEKESIARKAAGYVEHGDVLFIDGGTTTFSLVSYLPNVPLRIITNSLRLMSYLNDPKFRNTQWDIYGTGGNLNHSSSLFTGPGTLHSIGFYYANKAFISIGGMNEDGLFNTSEGVAETERLMIERSDKCFVLADSSKLGNTSMCYVCPLEEIDAVVTSIPKENRKLDFLKKCDVQLVTVAQE